MEPLPRTLVTCSCGTKESVAVGLWEECSGCGTTLFAVPSIDVPCARCKRSFAAQVINGRPHSVCPSCERPKK